MPETSDSGLPGQQPQAQAAPGQGVRDPSVASPARQSRPPVWRCRSVLITSIAAVAAAVAAVVLWPGSLAQPQQYTTLPPPCMLVTATALARYLPGATSAPLGPSLPGGCRWVSTSGPQGQRELVVVASIFGSSSGVTLARQAFNANAHSTISSPGSATTVTRQSVTGLGDQVVAQMVQLGKDFVPRTPIVVVDVRSRNAVVIVTLNIKQAGSAPPPTGPQLLSDTIAIARDVLAVLADSGTT
jgi:hypothetical protein